LYADFDPKHIWAYTREKMPAKSTTLRRILLAILCTILVSCNAAEASPSSNPAPTTPPVAEIEGEATLAPPDNTLDVNQLQNVTTDIESVGYSLDSGELVWQAIDQLELNSDDPASVKPIDYGPQFQDFILGADIDWKLAERSIGGCGIVFRAKDNFSEVITFEMRLEPMISSWNVKYWKDGNGDTLLGNLARAGLTTPEGLYDEAIRTDSNHIIMVVEDLEAKIYANGILLGSRYEMTGVALPIDGTGGIAVYPWVSAGTSTCTFSNVWVWALN
jgi:hypothetical protein